MAKLKPQGKIIIGVAFVALGLGVAYKTGLLDDAAGTAAAVPTDIALPQAQDEAAAAAHTTSGPVTMPGSAVHASGTAIRYLGFAWNSQMGLMFSNGGPETTEGSLMASKGIHLTIARQDDVSAMQAALVECARELSGGAAECTGGAQFMAVMGDGTPSIIRGLNAALSVLPGDGMKAEIIASAGYSRGEDQFMGPVTWRDNPQAAKGGVVAGVLRDGDWNLAIYWAAQNDICNNPDPTTYDPDCLNWVGTSTYLEPVEKYNAGSCETRPVVSHGRRTGETHRVCVDSVVTWTPGDVNVVHGKGGLVTLMDTRMNASQMPNAIIGIRKWNQGHREAVTNFVAAIALGGAAVASDPRALTRASEISDVVYHESGTGPMYWETYFRGREETDRVSGQTVRLGGSKVNNIADMQALFGLLPGTANAFAATYTAFGNVMVAQYPREMPDFPAFATVSDTSYITAAAEQLANLHETAEAPVFASATAETSHVVGRRNWSITFVTGSADFTPESLATLRDLKDQLLVASGTLVDIHGHTDNVGDAAMNTALSERRAQAVSNWLRAQSAESFPASRVRTYGHGSASPVDPAVDNNSGAARARNRRVTIELRAS